MPDKKVSRTVQGRPLTPKQRMEESLSDPGTVSMAEPRHERTHAHVVDKFREREERWRREQSLHDQEAEAKPLLGREVIEEAVKLAEDSEPPATQEHEKGGDL